MKRRRVSISNVSHVNQGDEDDETDTQESIPFVSKRSLNDASEEHDTLPMSLSDLREPINNVHDSETTKTKSIGASSSRNQPSACLQTPHTMRLLKLIREGSPEYASMAVERLAFTCTSSTSPLQLWDLLGRLQAFLSAPEWSTRQIAAQAIYVVAHHLPLLDQYQFLASTAGFHHDPNEKINSNDDQNYGYLTVNDLLLPNDARWGHGRSGMDTVLAEGRELFALDESKYVNNVVGERSNSSSSDPTNEDAPTASVMHRVRHQRRLLAMRLGLSVMTDVIGDDQSSSMIPVLTQDDLPTEQSGSDVRQQHSRRIQEATLQTESSVGNGYDLDVQEALEIEPQNPHSIRALLVREIFSVHSDTSPSTWSRHRNPQLLLANELLYRMFDPIWYVRHGALLGILSLLRAWTKSYQSKSTIAQGESEVIGASHLFGIWPHDLLARCLCVLALDRFGDFAGDKVDLGSDMVGITSTLTSLCTSVVAPVREICGQTVAVLHSMAPSHVAEQTRQLLLQLSQCGKSWEVRHGALIALKYIAVVEAKGLLSELSSLRNVAENSGILKASEIAKSFSNNEWINGIRHAGVVGLSDGSDDVKSASAHLILELFSGTAEDYCHSIAGTEFVADVVPALWHALQGIRPVSTCIVDLVSVLNLLVNRDCALLLRSLPRRSFDSCNAIYDENPSAPISDMLSFLVKLLDSDFSSVRISSLHSIGVIMLELRKSQSCEHWNSDSFESLCKTLQLVAARIVYLFRRLSDLESDSEVFPSNILHDTWSHISDACVTLLDNNNKASLDVVLLSTYFEAEDENVNTETKFSSLVHAANALAYYFSGSAQAAHLSDLVPSALQIFLHSPSPLQCESACLLYRALAPRLVQRSSFEAFEKSLDFDMVLPCLVGSRRNNTDADYVASCLVNGMAASNCSYALADGYVDVWTKLLPVNQHRETLSSVGCPLTSMRVSATLAGAVLTKGLPSQLTPLVRVLVTFFNNECVSRPRAALVAEYIVELLELLMSNPKFERAYRKVLDTVCDAVTHRSCGGRYNDFRIKFSSTIIRSFVKNRSQMISFQDIPSFWLRLLPITRRDDTEGDTRASVLDAIDLLNVFIEGHCDLHRCILELVDKCTPYLIELVLTNVISREQAIPAIVSLLRISPEGFLQVAVPLLKVELQNRADDQRRFSSCKILYQLVEVSGTKFSAFLRMLLPIILSLMTDNFVECAQCATATFALLVKIAPLVRPPSSDNQNISEDHESVIDHLIFGRPLPCFELPKELTNSLRQKNIVLRNYQKEGITWMRFLQSVNLSGALCDDMGTGKTVQALVAIGLSHIAAEHRSKHASSSSVLMEVEAPRRSLVVCPATLVAHWDGEIAKCFAPGTVFTSLCLTGSVAERFRKWSCKSKSVNIVIVSYAVLRSDIGYLETEKWCYCVLDEGHLLKNPKTATASATKRLIAQHKLVLTGTLIQNRIHELWATFDFLMPGFLGTSKAFVANFAHPIARSQLPAASASDIAIGIAKLKQLHQQVLPFILRREKNQVLSELPQMSQTVIHVPMSCIQKNIYHDFCTQTASQELLVEMEKSLNASDPVAGISKNVLKSLLFLRLLCTHPSLVLTKQQQAECPSTYLSVNASGKMLALADLLRTALQCDDDIFGADGDISLLYEDNAFDDQEGLSGVLDAPDPCFGDIVSIQSNSRRTVASQTSKCLIFAQFTKSLDVVENVVLKSLMPSVTYVRLDGTVSPERRMNVVARFQQDPNVRVLLLTTRVGGIGLNLTAANTVIFLEIDFNPYADFQAQDRCMRIGQTKQVNVYRIVTQGSIEEKMLELQSKKVVVTEAIVNNDNSTLYSMGTDRLLDVFTVEDHNNDSTSVNGLKFEYDLEGVVEQCSIDYKNLSVDIFAQTFGGFHQSEVSER